MLSMLNFQPDTTSPKHKYEHDLRRIFRFSEVALRANREGKYSANQIARLRWEFGWRFLACVIGGFVCAFCFTLNPSNLWSWILIFLLLFCCAWGFTAYSYWADLRYGKPNIVQGQIRLRIHGHNRSRVYQLSVENIDFILNKRRLLAFKNNEQYTIYYAQESEMILAVEWMR